VQIFYVIDIGFIVCIVLWALFFVGYQAAMMRKWSSYLMVDLQHKWTKRDYFFYVVLIACSVFWILLAVLLLVYLAFFHAPSEVKTATPASQSTNAASPPTGAPEQTTPLVENSKSVGSHFNQRFPKIATGDCRPKYSRVSTSAC
jgi:magnesium-transporting ATPase (P-type)